MGEGRRTATFQKRGANGRSMATEGLENHGLHATGLSVAKWDRNAEAVAEQLLLARLVKRSVEP